MPRKAKAIYVCIKLDSEEYYIAAKGSVMDAYFNTLGNAQANKIIFSVLDSDADALMDVKFGKEKKRYKCSEGRWTTVNGGRISSSREKLLKRLYKNFLKEKMVSGSSVVVQSGRPNRNEYDVFAELFDDEDLLNGKDWKTYSIIDG